MVFPKIEIVELIKAKYKKGMRVKLTHMEDLYSKIPIGTEGTVRCVDDCGTIHVNWDIGSSLGIVYGVDSCIIID